MGITKITLGRRKPEIDIEKFKQLTAPPPPCGMEIIQDALKERRRQEKQLQDKWDAVLKNEVPILYPEVNGPSHKIPKRCDGCGAPQQINKCKYCGSII